MQNKNLQELEEDLGYRFKNISLLKTALTHSSYSNELKIKKINAECNERLEFLGDSAISITAADYLFKKYSDCPEGDLTKMRAAIVCSDALSQYARKIHLGDFLYLGNGEEKNHARERRSLLENAFEALMGAVYLDSGEDRMLILADLLIPFFKKELEEWENGKTAKDYKTELQQIVQQSGEDTLEYVTVGESGPDHEKVFDVEVRINSSNVFGRGKGSSKREAEQNAAKEALKKYVIKA